MVAPGIFAQGGGCGGMAYENPVGHRRAPDGATYVADAAAARRQSDPPPPDTTGVP
jgi:hypothetical protein